MATRWCRFPSCDEAADGEVHGAPMCALHRTLLVAGRAHDPAPEPALDDWSASASVRSDQIGLDQPR